MTLGFVLAIQPQTSQANDPQAATKQVMPDALAALERMGGHLKTLKQFTLSAATTSEDVLDDDEKITIGGNITYRVRSPDRLSLDLRTDKRDRRYFYNGKTLTVYAPALKFYSIVPAPDTIAKTINEVEDTYGIEVPLADLFYLGTKGSKADASNIVSAFYVAIRQSMEPCARTTPTARQRRISRSGSTRRASRFPAKLSGISSMTRLARNTQPC